LPVARWKGALIGALATACLFFAPSAFADTCAPGLSYSGLVSRNPLAGVRAVVRPIDLPSVQSGWTGTWVGVGGGATVAGHPGRSIRVGLVATSGSAVSLVYEVSRPGAPTRAREIYRFVKPREEHRVTVVAGKHHPNRWYVHVDWRKVSGRIKMRPGADWRAFTTVESAVSDSATCNSLKFQVKRPTAAKRVRTRHGLQRRWSDLNRRAHFDTAGSLVAQRDLTSFVVGDPDSVATPPVDPPTGSGPILTWSPPRLFEPTTVKVGPDGGQVNLRTDRDYVVAVGDANGPVRLVGGHNVVLIGGHITIPWAGTDASISSRLGLYLKGQTGTVHVEGLLIDNAGGDLSEGIQINAPSAVVQIENVRIEGIHARDEVNFSDNHPDLVQPWGGVKALRIDRLSGITDCQGFFLVGNEGTIGRVDLRNIDIVGTNTSKYILWQGAGVPVKISNVWISPAASRSLALSVWPDKNHAPPTQAIVNSDGSVGWTPETGITGVVFPGTPSGGEFVPANATGLNYVSPGYQ
jgi:hypothetical protein